MKKSKNQDIKLDKDLLIKAVRKSILNAADLIKDATILKDHKRIPRSYALFQLAMEEVGKAMTTYGFLLFEDFENKEAQAKFLKNSKDHKKKTSKAIGFDFFLLEALKSNQSKKEFIKFINKQYSNLDRINDLKNLSLYASFYKDDFVLPTEVISIEELHGIEVFVKFRYTGAEKIINIGLENFEGVFEAAKKIDKEVFIQEEAKKLAKIMFDNSDTNQIDTTS